MVWQSNHIDLLYEAARRQFQPRPGAVLCVVLLQRKQKDENRDRRHRSRQKPLITQTEDGRQTGRDANGVCCDH